MRPLPKLTFGKPENGWLPIQIGNHKQIVSDVPCDSLHDLLSGLGALLSGSKKEEIEWSLEPAYEKWIFEDEGAVFSWRIESEENQLIQAIHGTKRMILSKIVTALSQLYSSHFSELNDENEVWSWDFPIELLKQLETKLAEPDAVGNG